MCLEDLKLDCSDVGTPSVDMAASYGLALPVQATAQANDGVNPASDVSLD